MSQYIQQIPPNKLPAGIESIIIPVPTSSSQTNSTNISSPHYSPLVNVPAIQISPVHDPTKQISIPNSAKISMVTSTDIVSGNHQALDSIFRKDPTNVGHSTAFIQERSTSPFSKTNLSTDKILGTPSVTQSRMTSYSNTRRFESEYIPPSRNLTPPPKTVTPFAEVDTKLLRSLSQEGKRDAVSPTTIHLSTEKIFTQSDSPSKATSPFGIGSYKEIPSPIGVKSSPSSRFMSGIDWHKSSAQDKGEVIKKSNSTFNLGGPGPELINSINKTLEDAKNKGLLKASDLQPPSPKKEDSLTVKHYQTHLRSPSRDKEGVGSLMSSPKQIQTPITFGSNITSPASGALLKEMESIYQSQQNTQRQQDEKYGTTKSQQQQQLLRVSSLSPKKETPGSNGSSRGSTPKKTDEQAVVRGRSPFVNPNPNPLLPQSQSPTASFEPVGNSPKKSSREVRNDQYSGEEKRNQESPLKVQQHSTTSQSAANQSPLNPKLTQPSAGNRDTVSSAGPGDFTFWGMQNQIPAFSLPSFGNDPQGVEVQNYLMFVMNFYELHLNNLKSIILQQNNTINDQRETLKKQDDQIRGMDQKVNQLEENMREQRVQYEQSYAELREKHHLALQELLSFKKNIENLSNHMEIASKRADIQVPERLSHNERTTNKLIFDEIIQIKRDLDQQREVISDFHHAKQTMETQMREIERLYTEEIRNSSLSGWKQSKIKSAMKKFRDDYLHMDKLNRMILDGYERTKLNIDSVRPSVEVDQQQEDRQEYRERDSRYPDELSDKEERITRPKYRSLSPQTNGNQPGENAYNAIRRKMKERDNEVKDLLTWNTRGSPNKNLHSHETSYDHGYRHRNGSPNSSLKQSPQGHKSYGVLPSHQKYEVNKEEIKYLENLLMELNKDKTLIETELFKVPASGGTVEQKKKKSALDRDLEDVESKIEECKIRLKKYDALNVRQP